VNVANDIGELKGEAEFFGQVERAGILKPKMCVQVRPTVPATR